VKLYSEKIREQKTASGAGERKSARGIKALLMALFILSFFSFFLAVFLVMRNGSYSSAVMDSMWLFFLPLPIPLASLIFGIIYKREGMKTTKNIVAGLIVAVFLCFYGFSPFLFQGIYVHDLSYLSSVSSEIHFTLPDKGKITTQKVSAEAKTSSDSSGEPLYCSTMSKFEVAGSGQAEELRNSLKGSDLWVTSLSNQLAGIVPDFYSMQTPKSADFDYFMVYNADLKVYNTVPEKPGTYHFFYLACDSKDGRLFIGEYSDTVAQK
jgi:hypothetical protein